MRENHRSDPKRVPNQQDKRMVVTLPDDAIEAWLDAPVERSMDFMRQFSSERLVATPEPVQTKDNTGALQANLI